MTQDPSAQGRRNSEPTRQATIIETDEEIRQALLSNLKGQHHGLQADAHPAPAPAPAPAVVVGRAASPFRPTARPAVALLTVCDDGKQDGEVIRLRDHRFVIGRTEGDLRVPIDGRISSRHVEITHQVVGGLHRWVVTDLQSTHGTFVRVTRTALADKAEFLIANGRYRFDAPQAESSATADYAPEEQGHGETHGWSDGPGPFRPPALTEMIGREIGNRIVLVKPEYWIGSDPTCQICRTDDPFCEPRHARLFRSQRGGWSAEHNKTHNGLWLRMSQITVESMVQFQLGEQRFRLKVN